mmetsp:Transcript_102238/g.234389  ORF Transcript_102238/g.234389 Transcript_102238/m.234389 type:complete len:84 (+) Transcript_102238:321-572(+)
MGSSCDQSAEKSLPQDKASEAAAPSFAPAAADNDRRPLLNHRVRTNLLKRWYWALSCALQRGNAQQSSDCQRDRRKRANNLLV